MQQETSPLIVIDLEASMGAQGRHTASVNPVSPDWVALVVEDDDDQRDLIGAILEESDVKVIGCDSAEAAIEVMEKVGNRTVFVLTDVDLAGTMDGIELARELGHRWPGTHVVTTSGGSDQRRLARLPKRSRHLEKPWRALDIIIELERAIAAH